MQFRKESNNLPNAVNFKVNLMQNAKCLPSFLISNKLIFSALLLPLHLSLARQLEWDYGEDSLSRVCAFFNPESHQWPAHTMATTTIAQCVVSGQDESPFHLIHILIRFQISGISEEKYVYLEYQKPKVIDLINCHQHVTHRAVLYCGLSGPRSGHLKSR